MAINFELLRKAAAIIDGIPEEQFDLDCIFTKGGKNPCGTIACAAGWLSLHPDFQKLGLRPAGDGSSGLAFGGRPWVYFDEAMKHVFNLDHVAQAQSLFGTRGESRYDYDLTSDERLALSDKQLFRHRVIAFLREHGQEVRA